MFPGSCVGGQKKKPPFLHAARIFYRWKGRQEAAMEKTDIHSHIIPGIDDGAKSLEESLAMLAMAAGQGIDSLIATPHYSPHYRNLHPELIREGCAHLEEQARASVSPDIRIYPGQEICYEDGILEKLEEGRLLTLADSSYVLIEFSYRTPYPEMYRSLQRIGLAGYSPVLAHAERYPALRGEEGSLDELVEAGVLIQMNYGSLEGPWHSGDLRWCRKQIKEERVHFLATDMHGADMRPPRTEKASAWMEKHLEAEKREALCRGNAEKLLKNENVL